MIYFRCKNCNRILKADDKFRSRLIKCRCGNITRIPESSDKDLEPADSATEETKPSKKGQKPPSRAVPKAKTPTKKKRAPLTRRPLPKRAKSNKFKTASFLKRELSKKKSDKAKSSSSFYRRSKTTKKLEETRFLKKPKTGYFKMPQADGVSPLRLKKIREKKETERVHKADMESAAEIQLALLPKRLPRVPGFDIYAYYSPCEEIGGDYYDSIPIDKYHLGLLVADVSGKGISGSMVMAMFRSILREKAFKNTSPSDILSKTNRSIYRDMKRGMFVTVYLVILDIRKNSIKFASAGHNPMALWRDRTKACEFIKPSGIAIGIDKGDMFDKFIREKEMKLLASDRFLLYTDGVTETMNSKKKMFGQNALKQIMIKNHALPSSAFVFNLISSLDKYKGKTPRHDDISICTARVTH